MTLLMRDQENIEKGFEKGIERGIERGENRVSTLLIRLLKEGRTKDMERALSDREYRQELYKSYGL